MLSDQRNLDRYILSSHQLFNNIDMAIRRPKCSGTSELVFLICKEESLRWRKKPTSLEKPCEAESAQIWSLALNQELGLL
jgi:hypothetical protein